MSQPWDITCTCGKTFRRVQDRGFDFEQSGDYTNCPRCKRHVDIDFEHASAVVRPLRTMQATEAP